MNVQPIEESVISGHHKSRALRHQVLVGTANGLYDLDAAAPTHFAGRPITALARDGRAWWVLVDGQAVWRFKEDGAWEEVAHVNGWRATCLAPTTAGLLVGTEGAHLLRLDGTDLVPVEAFEAVEGRTKWYTPWGDPADTRSLASDPSGTIYVNVHVGGIVRSADRGQSWQPTVDIQADVHQVLAEPARPGLVLVAAAIGFGMSTDRGESWSFETDGLHATYARAIALADDVVLITASTGPSGKQAAVYRRRLATAEPFERCRHGLPEWFSGNINTSCLAACGASVVMGTADGSVFLSPDQGETWERIASGLPQVHCVAIG